MVPLCSMMFQLHHVNTKWLNVSIERKLKDIGIQNGCSEVHNIVCVNYRKFKSKHGVENYIKSLDEGTSIHLTKFIITDSL